MIRAAAAFDRKIASVREQARKLGTPFPHMRAYRKKFASDPSSSWRRFRRRPTAGQCLKSILPSTFRFLKSSRPLGTLAANRRYRMATCLPWPSKSVSTVSMKCLHLRHSNVRLSKPFGPRTILAKLIRVRHFGQIGRWIAGKDGRDVSLEKASGTRCTAGSGGSMQHSQSTIEAGYGSMMTITLSPMSGSGH